MIRLVLWGGAQLEILEGRTKMCFSYQMCTRNYPEVISL